MAEKAYFNWSSGKDSALALYHAVNSGKYSVETLFTLLNCDGKKVSMHETGYNLLRRQAEAIGIPLTVLLFRSDWSAEQYSFAMTKQMKTFKDNHIETALFGDLFLEELRNARIQSCAEAGIRAEFPLWNAVNVMEEFLDLGFKAVVTCVNGSVLPDAFVGRVLDRKMLSEFPEGADICGENGEYHSFVFDGPVFHHPVDYKIRRKFFRDYPSDGGSTRYFYAELVS